MVQQLESSPVRPSERVVPSSQEKESSQLDIEIEQCQEQFVQSVEWYQQALVGKKLQETVQQLTSDLLKNEAGNPPLEVATEFFALVSTVESIYTGRHRPNWEQAEAALHIIFPYSPTEVQRILMAPGEGKTFTIALAALWKARHGEMVTIHTDKKANVEQSYQTTRHLYDLFGVTSDTVRTTEDLGPEYVAYLNSELTQVRYGVWSQFIHEYLLRQETIFQCEAALRGDLRAQREGKIRVGNRQLLDQQLAHQRKYLKPDAVISDEGDVSVDLETSPVILSEPNGEGFTPVEQAELELAWQMFEHQDPAALQRMADATGFDVEDVRAGYEVTPEITVEGMEDDQVTYAVNKNRVIFAPEKIFFASVFEMSATPKDLATLFRLVQLQYQEGSRSALPFPAESMQKIVEIALAAGEGLDARFDWQEVAEVLPPLQRQDLRHFFRLSHPLFDYRRTLTEHPRIQALISTDGELSPADWQMLETELGDSFEMLKQRVTFSRLMDVVQEVCDPIFTRHNHDVMEVRDMLKEGNDYKLTEQDGEPTVVVLGQDRQPQVGRQFQGNTQAFIHLKHGLSLPETEKTVGQIMPITWYHQRVRNGTEVTSISGTQEDPDFVVETTGTSKVRELQTRVLENQAQKLRAIMEYVKGRADVPILLCAQDRTEWEELKNGLAQLSNRELILLDADHAEDSYTLVPQLARGKILLLQMTSRGLDFGHMIGEGEHSFQDGVIVGAAPLLDVHQSDQMKGRLGNKRPSGEVVIFTSLDDEVAQQYYNIATGLSEKRHKQMENLELDYDEVLSLDRYKLMGLGWPETFAEAMTQLDSWQEAAARAAEDGEQLSMPTWMQVLVNDPGISAEMRPTANSLRFRFRSLLKKYQALREGHAYVIERQQHNNLVQTYLDRREQMSTDVVVQALWKAIMTPTTETKLGKAVLPLTYEERKGVVEAIFEDANILYSLSVTKVKADQQESPQHREMRRMAQFMQDMEERILDWIEMADLERQYAELSPQPKYEVPENLDQLPAWMDEHFPVEKKKPLQRLMSSLAQFAFLGLQMEAQSRGLPLPPIEETNTHAEDLELTQLRSLAEKVRRVQVKYEGKL
ncbi:hypothetical protein H3C66_04260 [Patescibacteria group bacterium]|nr:hypothetical protein [Patescibacteria group bacterium]